LVGDDVLNGVGFWKDIDEGVNSSLSTLNVTFWHANITHHSWVSAAPIAIDEMAFARQISTGGVARSADPDKFVQLHLESDDAVHRHRPIAMASRARRSLPLWTDRIMFWLKLKNGHVLPSPTSAMRNFGVSHAPRWPRYWAARQFAQCRGPCQISEMPLVCHRDFVVEHELIILGAECMARLSELPWPQRGLPCSLHVRRAEQRQPGLQAHLQRARLNLRRCTAARMLKRTKVITV
jgi:hypothetical protein